MNATQELVKVFSQNCHKLNVLILTYILVFFSDCLRWGDGQRLLISTGLFVFQLEQVSFNICIYLRWAPVCSVLLVYSSCFFHQTVCVCPYEETPKLHEPAKCQVWEQFADILNLFCIYHLRTEVIKDLKPWLVVIFYRHRQCVIG